MSDLEHKKIQNEFDDEMENKDNLGNAEVVAIERIGFGSCNKQTKPQTHWQMVEDMIHPQLWLGLGDNVYAKNTTFPSLQSAYDSLLHNSLYQEFQSKVRIEGVWDDHDYGRNDAGRHIDNYPIRKQSFLQFMKNHSKFNSFQSPNPKQKVNCIDSDCDSRGIYYYTDFNLNCNDFDGSNPLCSSGSSNGRFASKVRVIFLDTRSFRDNHFVKSLSEYHFPLSAHLAALVRTASAMFGLSAGFDGNVLGEEQWEWLDKTLSSSDADFHVIVSSIQVLTSNPVFESWGHFPIEKQRLLRLLEDRNPMGVFFLSGDVHHAEIARASRQRADGEEIEPLVEVTSSGLTHSCVSGLQKYICPPVVRAFTQHRLYNDSYFLGKNFGYLSLGLREVQRTQQQVAQQQEVCSANGYCSTVVTYQPYMNISVISIDQGSVVLQTLVPSDRLVEIDPLACSNSQLRNCFTRRSAEKGSITSTGATPFFRLSEQASADTIANLLIASVILVLLLLWVMYRLTLSILSLLTRSCRETKLSK